MESIVAIVGVCLALGAVVGIMAGLLGIGGGLIIVPVLVYFLADWLQLPASETFVIAIATSLSTIIFTGISSARAHYKLGNLDRIIVIWSGIGIGLGAVVGAQIASHISGESLKRIFAVLVLLIALYMIFGARRESEHQASKLTLGIVGSVVGTISALMGIGGGALLVPALVWYRVNIRAAIGCAAFSGILIAVFGSASFVITGWHYNTVANGFIGYIFWPATLCIAMVSVLTAPLGAKLGQRMNTQGLKKIFAVFLVIVSIRMLWGF